MIPLLFTFGPIPVHSFGLMVALALIAGTVRLGQSFEAYGINRSLAERYVMWGGVSGIIGARLWYLFEHFSEISHNFFGALFASAGFTFYGGFIVAAFVIIVRARIDKIPVPVLGDALGPTLAIGYAIGRLGCQLSGDGDYGVSTTGFWGMSFAQGTVPTEPGVRVYPTPLFESVWSVAIAFFLVRLEKSNTFRMSPGARFAVYLFLISIERFVIEFLRLNPILWASLSEAQCVAIGLLIISGIMFTAARVSAKAS